MRVALVLLKVASELLSVPSCRYCLRRIQVAVLRNLATFWVRGVDCGNNGVHEFLFCSLLSSWT